MTRKHYDRRHHDWLPHQDRRLRAMWADPWSWTVDDIADSIGSTDHAVVVERARALGLGRRPSKTGAAVPAQVTLAEFKRQQRRAQEDRVRRLRLRQRFGPAVVAAGCAGHGLPAREAAPELRALVDEALARRDGANHREHRRN